MNSCVPPCFSYIAYRRIASARVHDWNGPNDSALFERNGVEQGEAPFVGLGLPEQVIIDPTLPGRSRARWARQDSFAR